MMRKLIIWAIIIAIFGVWASVIYKSCNDAKQNPSPSTHTSNPTDNEDLDERTTTEITDDYDDRANKLDGEAAGATDGEGEVDMTDLDEDEVDEEEAADTIIETEDTNTPSINDGASERLVASEGDWKYLVVAGAFKSRENAKGMLNKLKKIGYQDAEIVQFDYDEHHAICIGRYSTFSAANSTAKELKVDHGVDNYVHRKRVKKKKR